MVEWIFGGRGIFGVEGFFGVEGGGRRVVFLFFEKNALCVLRNFLIFKKLFHFFKGRVNNKLSISSLAIFRQTTQFLCE
jgi:hypothetical protein